LKSILANSLSKSEVQSTKEVEQILAKKLNSEHEIIDFSKLWDASSFELGRVSSFQKLDEKAQYSILEKLSIGRFLEAYNIEKAGMSFTAKMSLLAESQNEQKLYSLFSAEEATHFHYIQNALSDSKVDYKADPFIELLNEVILTGERRPLIFIIQVVLEGWGIDHYSLMEKTCLNPKVRNQLRLILQDEAAHHGSGLSLYNESDFTESEMNYTADMMSEFLKMVNCGPVGVMTVLGENISSSKLSGVYDELNAHFETQRKLNYIKGLMIKANSNKLIDTLESKKLFIPNFS
jgi:hypothetical protein